MPDVHSVAAEPLLNSSPVHVLFCTKDAGFARVMARALGDSFEVRHETEVTAHMLPGLESWWNVVALDLCSVECEQDLEGGLRILGEINKADLPPPVIVMHGNEDHRFVLKMMEHGAYDAASVPPNMLELRLILRRACNYYEAQRELSQLRNQDPSGARLQDLIGASIGMQQVFALARKVAPCDVNALITGETGTGKELLARAIHKLSGRSTGPFVGFSCASLPETLIEDELFGHERGAFTGALAVRRGRFEAADQGTLFLDEIGDLGLDMQSKLLRVLQSRSFERLGSNTPVTVNIRLICATNRNLAAMVESGSFREDLYYRLNVVQLHLPPLRERRDDILFLAHYFLSAFSQQFGKKVRRFSRLALHALEEYHWRGNVRELENMVQRAVVLAEGSTIEVWHLPSHMRKGFDQPESVHSYDEEVRDFKRRLIIRTLGECNWRKAETARTLGMARGYLHRLINQLQIVPEPSFKDALADKAPALKVKEMPDSPLSIRRIM